jgi:glutathione S-transferase
MEKKIALRRAFVAGPMARVCGYVEHLLARSGGPFLLGTTMTIGDILVGNQLGQMKSGRLDGITSDDLAPFPRLLALSAAYESEPRIVAYHSR